MFIEVLIGFIVGGVTGLVMHDKALAVYEWINSKLHLDTVDVVDTSTTAEQEVAVAKDTTEAAAVDAAPAAQTEETKQNAA